MLATAAFVAITVLYFRISYTLMVLVLAVFTSAIFLADSSAFLLPSSNTTNALDTSKFFRILANFFVLISSKLSLISLLNGFWRSNLSGGQTPFSWGGGMVSIHVIFQTLLLTGSPQDMSFQLCSWLTQ